MSLTNHQGRNFGLKVGVPIQKQENVEMGGVFPPHPTREWESVVSCLSGVRGGAPAENGFKWVHSMCSQLVGPECK